MPRAFVLALDIGSSSTRAALFDDKARRVPRSMATVPYAIRYTAAGGAELDPKVLLAAAKSCIEQTLRAAGTTSVIAVTGSAFWHSLIGLDQRGAPVTPVFTWADARSAADAAQLRQALSERRVQMRTGCMLRAAFWPAKLRWLKRTQPALFRRVARWVSPATWIFEELFRVSATSHSMASGTGLYNLRHRAWDEELCELCGVSAENLGIICDSVPSSHAIGQVFAPVGDGGASNLGSGADRSGLVAINIGTSAAARMIIARDAKVRLPFGLFRYVVDESSDVIGGAVSNAGNLHSWGRKVLRVADSDAFDRTAAAEAELIVLPHLVPERAPTWPENIRGMIAGLTAATSAADVFGAMITASYYRLAEILDLLESATGQVERVIVSGGVLKSPTLLPILADALGRDVQVSRELESSLRGAAIHALRQLGHEAIAPLRAGRVIRHRPQLSEQHRKRRLQQQALERDALSSR